MTLSVYSLPQLSVLVFLLAVIVYIDTKKHKIPNNLVLLVLVSGIGIQVFNNGLQGAVSALLGIAIGLLLLLPFYALGGMRAGDVKLMSSLGSYLGLGTFMGVAMTLIMGFITALFILLLHKDLIGFLRRYYHMIKQTVLFHSVAYIPAEKGSSARLQFPYASSIASGALLTIYLFPDLRL